MSGADKGFELFDLGACGLKEADVFVGRLELSLPLVDRTMYGEEIQASGKALLDGFASKGLRQSSFRKSDVEKNRAHFASESLKTRLPTDFFWPWYFPR
jgi:hypothetical protein